MLFVLNQILRVSQLDRAVPDSYLLLTEVFPPQVGGSGKWLFEVYRRLRGKVVVAAGEDGQSGEFDEGQGLAMRRMETSQSIRQQIVVSL